MIPTVVRFQIDARIIWAVTRSSQTQRWVGVCDALKVTAEADTWEEFYQVVNEIHNELFRDLLEEGRLQEFLLQHGWTPITPLPTRATGDVVFDIPPHLIPMVVNDRPREIHQ